MSEELNNENYLAKWLQGELSEEEIQRLKTDEDLSGYESIVNEIDNWKVKDLDVAGSFKNLKVKLDESQNETKVIKINTRRKFIVAIAATVTLLVASYVVFINFSSPKIRTYASAPGEQKDIELPDGTEIVIGGKTTLSFEVDNYYSNKSVKLNGSAYFKVVKGKDFKVQLDNGLVHVLGTRYDIRSSKDYFSVECYEGRVKVTSDNNDLEILTKGMGLHYLKGKNFESFDVATDEPEWISKKSVFNNTSLIEVIDALEAQYPIQIDITNIDINRKFTGSFVNHDLKVALELVFVPLDIQYEVNGKNVTLK